MKSRNLRRFVRHTAILGACAAWGKRHSRPAAQIHVGALRAARTRFLAVSPAFAEASAGKCWLLDQREVPSVYKERLRFRPLPFSGVLWLILSQRDFPGGLFGCGEGPGARGEGLAVRVVGRGLRAPPLGSAEQSARPPSILPPRPPLKVAERLSVACHAAVEPPWGIGAALSGCAGPSSKPPPLPPLRGESEQGQRGTAADF